MAIQDTANAVASQAKELQRSRINPLPEEVNDLIRQVEEVRRTYEASVRGSGLGQERFMSVTDQLISRMREVARMMESVKL